MTFLPRQVGWLYMLCVKGIYLWSKTLWLYLGWLIAFFSTNKKEEKVICAINVQSFRDVKYFSVSLCAFPAAKVKPLVSLQTTPSLRWLTLRGVVWQQAIHTLCVLPLNCNCNCEVWHCFNTCGVSFPPTRYNLTWASNFWTCHTHSEASWLYPPQRKWTTAENCSQDWTRHEGGPI